MNSTANALVGFVLTLSVVPALAASVTVAVGGVSSEAGAVGCALFSTADGFPMQTGNAVLQWHPAKRTGVSCRFEGLKAGTYAVSVSHDLNGNRRTDTDILGRPTEDWGVSRGARPSLRAPRFDEAAFVIAEDAKLRINVTLGR